MKPGLLIVKSRVKIDPTFEKHIGYVDFTFANRQHKKFENVYLKSFGSSNKSVLSRSLTQSKTKLSNTISMNLDHYSGLNVGGFIESLEAVFNVVEG